MEVNGLQPCFSRSKDEKVGRPAEMESKEKLSFRVRKEERDRVHCAVDGAGHPGQGKEESLLRSVQKLTAL